MTGLEIGLAVGLSLLAGAEIGSYFEYKKNYNLYDLEKDETSNLLAHLHGLVQTLLYQVERPFSKLNQTATQVVENVQKAL